MSTHFTPTNEFLNEVDGEISNTPKHSVGTAFLLWVACVFGLCGIHRFYLGKPWSGLLYLLTFGLLGIGQVVDLFYMKEMAFLADQRPRRLRGKKKHKLLPPAAIADSKEALRQKLVMAAQTNHGRLSVSQGVIATGKSFKEVEALLDEMLKSGYADIDNDPQTGAVVYLFGELIS